MKYPYFKRLLGAYFLFASCVLFFSCRTEQMSETLHNVTYKQSQDFAKLHESGPSNINYDSKSGWNFITYTEVTIWGYHFYGEADKDIEYGFNSASDKTVKSGFGTLGFGLEYINKGAKFSGNGGKISLNYIQVPIDFLYHYPIGPGNAYGGLGPYFAYGIGGSDGGESSFGENNGGFKRFDAGAGFLLGYKLNMGVSLDFGYDLGLANIEYASQDVKGHSRCFSINLGYQIGKLFVRNKK